MAPIRTLEKEVVIIGAGTAGMSAHRAAVAHTQDVLVIESGVYGTTCARVGCMPSKLMIAAAEAAHGITKAPAFGVQAGELRIDGEAVMRRIRSERDRFAGFAVEAVAQWPKAHRLQGHARFIDAHTLQVDDHTRIHAKSIVIATGSRSRVPREWRQALGDRLILNDDVFDWQTLPASVAVIGAGAIGLELAQALHRLGVRIRLFGRGGKVGPLTDPALTGKARGIFSKELPLSADAQEMDLHRDGDNVVVNWQEAGHPHSERFEWLLVAMGRQANVDELGLAHTGLPLDEDGQPVFDRCTARIGDSHVFIAGDANDDRPLLHEAAAEGRIAGDNAGRYPDVRVSPRTTPLSIVFTDPQFAMVGRSHKELTAGGSQFAIGGVSFEDQGRSRVKLVNQGALQLYGEHGSGLLLGAEMVGPEAEHLAHLLAWSVQRSDTVADLLAMPYYHPVIEEGVRTAARALQHALHMGPEPVKRCIDCGPGA
jgi:dihydrolipoamide dehydrogenase